MTIPVDAGPVVAGAPVPPEPQWKPPSWRVRLVIVAVLAIAVAAIGLAGGLAKAPDPAQASIPVVGVNVEVEGGPWTMTVTSAAIESDLGGAYSPHEGNYELLVAVRVGVPGTDPESAAQLDRIVTLPGYVGLVEPEPRWVVLYRDATEVQWISPGLPETLIYIFEVRDTTPVPARITVELNGYVPHWDFTAQRNEWWDFGPHARVDVPVKDAR